MSICSSKFSTGLESCRNRSTTCAPRRIASFKLRNWRRSGSSPRALHTRSRIRVNNFSALCAELIEEMKDVLSEISVGNGKREEIDEITRMLKSNLEKVVQHGKRADSI